MDVVVCDAASQTTYRLYDTTDTQTGFSSMARTTGYTTTAAARLVLDGVFARKGVSPPDTWAAHEGSFDHVLTDLARRGVTVERRTEAL